MPHAECPMAVTLKEGRPIRGQEAVAERPDGTRVPFMPYPTPLFDGDGRLVGAVDLLMDITDQKRAQAEAQRMRSLPEERVEHRTQALSDTTDRLKESEQTFQLLVQSVTDYAIFMLDPKGHVANWNPGAERIKGYTRAEIIGEHFSRFYTEEDRLAGVPAQALATARREGRFEQENWRIRKDGTRFWANVVIDAIHDERGELIGFAKVTRDLTERRMVEEKLRQSQKMDALGQLTGGIAHDFNNLLTVITGNLEVLGRSLSGARAAQPAPRTTRAIAAAMEGARRAAALTQRLLAFSRQQALEPKTIDPNRLVHRTVDMLRRTLGERVTIKTTLAPDAGRICADPVELENALLTRERAEPCRTAARSPLKRRTLTATHWQWDRTTKKGRRTSSSPSAIPVLAWTGRRSRRRSIRSSPPRGLAMARALASARSTASSSSQVATC